MCLWLYVYTSACAHGASGSWEEGWELLFTVDLLYLLTFVPCTCIVDSTK